MSDQKLKPDGTGYKLDGAKNRLELVPPDAIEGLGRVLTYGAQKYPAHNWARGMAWSRVYGAALRHLAAFWGGEDLDAESELPHLEHALCCLAFLVTYQRRGLGDDDRFEWPKAPVSAPAREICAYCDEPLAGAIVCGACGSGIGAE